MLKKLTVIVLLLISSAFAQDISIFFLKDGSIVQGQIVNENQNRICLLYTSPSPRDVEESRMPSSA